MDEIKVFISGSDELNDEKKFIFQAIEELPKFEPILFGSLGARTEPPRDAYLEGVRNCDIYLGVFHKKFSAPTVDEYNEAFKLGREVLIYVKEISEGTREEKLSRFIIDTLKENHTILNFRDVTDLKTQVKNDLIGLLARRFKPSTISKMETTNFEKKNIILAYTYPQSFPDPFDTNNFMRPFHFPVEFKLQNDTDEPIDFITYIRSPNQAIGFVLDEPIKKVVWRPYPHRETMRVFLNEFIKVRVDPHGQVSKFTFHAVYRPKFALDFYPERLVIIFESDGRSPSGARVKFGPTRIEIPFAEKEKKV